MNFITCRDSEDILDNAVYSAHPSSSQFQQQRDERVLGNADRRKIRQPEKYAESSCVGQILAYFDDGRSYYGTGTLVKLGNARTFIITCAHNFIARKTGLRDEYHKCVNAWFYAGRDGEAKYLDRINEPL